MTIAHVHAGIDISKDAIDICLRDGNRCSWRKVATLRQELRAAARWLVSQGVTMAVLEPSGGYERPVIEACRQAGLAVAPVNAKRVRDFARASGLLAKTDRIDAQVLLRYGELMDPPETQEHDESIWDLQTLVRHRRRLVKMRSQLKAQITKPGMDLIRGQIEALIAFIGQQIGDCERRIRKRIKVSRELKDRHDLLRSMKGVGEVAAWTVLAELPLLGRVNARQAAALAGLAPFNNDSVTLRGKRRCQGGNSYVRRVLYMSALTASRAKGRLRTFFDRLMDRGKPFKIAITALMRKMVIILNAMLAKNKPYAA